MTENRWRSLLSARLKSQLRSFITASTEEAIRSFQHDQLDESIEKGRPAIALYVAVAADSLAIPALKQISYEMSQFVCLKSKLGLNSLYAGAFGRQWLKGLWSSKDSRNIVSALPPPAKLRKQIASEPDVDVVLGLSGFGLALLQTKSSPAIFRPIVKRIFELLQPIGDDRAGWPAIKRNGRPIPVNALSVFDYGLAHGSPGVILFLSYLHQTHPGLLSTRHRAEVDRVLHDLISVNEERGGIPYFNDSPQGELARGGWCYGDPGVGFCIYQAGIAFDNEYWKDYGVEVAHRGLSKSLEESNVKTPFFCHGAIGLAHIASRFYQMTEDERFRSLAKTWYRRAFALFENFREEKNEFPRNDLIMGHRSFLLFAMAGASDKDPSFDSLVGLSRPGHAYSAI